MRVGVCVGLSLWLRVSVTGGKKQQNHHWPVNIHKYTSTHMHERHTTPHDGAKRLGLCVSIYVCVCVCVCSLAAGFMPHRVSLPAR